MAIIGQNILNISRCMNINIIVNGFHTSLIRQLDQTWRKKNRLAKNPNRYGPLTNLPDYSYADGRPTPFGVRQLGRIEKEKEVLTKVKKLVYEIDHAVERHARMQQKTSENRKKMIEGKLKPKGQSSLSEPNVEKLE